MCANFFVINKLEKLSEPLLNRRTELHFVAWNSSLFCRGERHRRHPSLKPYTLGGRYEKVSRAASVVAYPHPLWRMRQRRRPRL